MVTLNGEKILDDVVRAYHAACLKHGRNKQLGEDMIWGAGVYLADSHAEAVRRLSPPMTSASSGSPRLVSYAMPTSKAAPGARRAHLHARRR